MCPQQLEERISFKLFKKGNLTDYIIVTREVGITPLGTWNGLLHCSTAAVANTMDKMLWEEQAGFCYGHLYYEQIFTLCNITEQYIEFQQPLPIDFREAFDSIHQDSLWNIVRS